MLNIFFKRLFLHLATCDLPGDSLAHLAMPKDWPVAEAAVGGPEAGKMLPMAYREA